MNLADFGPGGHRHGCDGATPGTLPCTCPGDLYVIALEADRQMRNSLMAEAAYADASVNEAVARTRISPAVWDQTSAHGRIVLAQAAEPVARAIRSAIYERLTSPEGQDTLASAIADPGAWLPRSRVPDEETVPRWSARAVALAVGGLLRR